MSTGLQQLIGSFNWQAYQEFLGGGRSSTLLIRLPGERELAQFQIYRHRDLRIMGLTPVFTFERYASFDAMAICMHRYLRRLDPLIRRRDGARSFYMFEASLPLETALTYLYSYPDRVLDSYINPGCGVSHWEWTDDELPQGTESPWPPGVAGPLGRGVGNP
jgi:hypothetical protein